MKIFKSNETLLYVSLLDTDTYLNIFKMYDACNSLVCKCININYKDIKNGELPNF